MHEVTVKASLNAQLSLTTYSTAALFYCFLLPDMLSAAGGSAVSSPVTSRARGWPRQTFSATHTLLPDTRMRKEFPSQQFFCREDFYHCISCNKAGAIHRRMDAFVPEHCSRAPLISDKSFLRLSDLSLPPAFCSSSIAWMKKC
jgi:hypothetical protein